MRCLNRLRRAGVGIDAHAVARRAAEQLVNRHAQRLALDVPERLVDAAERAGENRAAAIERMPIDGLPVMRYRPRVLADEVRLDFLDRRRRTSWRGPR